jgi:hypothetical protein
MMAVDTVGNTLVLACLYCLEISKLKLVLNVLKVHVHVPHVLNDKKKLTLLTDEKKKSSQLCK